MSQQNSKVNILGLEIDATTMEQFQKKLEEAMVSSNRLVVGKVNTEFLLRAKENSDFKETLNGFDINIADGKGVLWAAKYLSLPLTKMPVLRQLQAIWQMKYTGASLVFYPEYCQSPIPENIPGLDAMYLMLEVANETKSGVYFFGAEKDVLVEAIDKIQKKYPNLKIVGYHDGYGYKDTEIIQDVDKSGARLLIVALGSPKQEYWIRDNIDRLANVRVAVGEGGSLDFVAGMSKRAPKWMQKLGLEWFWRLFANKSKSHTGSRAKRVWKAVPVFISEVVRWKLRKNGSNQ